MKKSERPAVIAELEQKFGSLTDKNIQEFGLIPIAPADISELGRHYGASNAGLRSARELDSLSQEEYDAVQTEVRAWTRVMKAGYKMAKRLGLELNNRNVILASHHREADKEYSNKED